MVKNTDGTTLLEGGQLLHVPDEYVDQATEALYLESIPHRVFKDPLTAYATFESELILCGARRKGQTSEEVEAMERVALTHGEKIADKVYPYDDRLSFRVENEVIKPAVSEYCKANLTDDEKKAIEFFNWGCSK